jgi:hypothetical protein
MTIKLYDKTECYLFNWNTNRKLYFRINGRTYEQDVPYGKELTIDGINAIYNAIRSKVC